MIFVGTRRAIPDVLEEHFEMLPVLWARRGEAEAGGEETLLDRRELDDRIEAHTDGLVLSGEAVSVVGDALLDEDPAVSLAAAFTLLALDTTEGAAAVVDAIAAAPAEGRAGLRLALCLGPARRSLPLLRRVAAGEDPPAAIAAEARAVREDLTAGDPRVSALLAAGDPEARAAGWRVVAHVDPGGGGPSRPWDSALADEAGGVRRAALAAAAWTSQDWLAGRLRDLATRRSAPEGAVARDLLAILAPPTDLPALRAIGEAEALGGERFRILGTYGHPGVVDLVLAGLESDDPATAHAAGRAFRKITGVDVDSEERVELPSPDGEGGDEEFEAEFGDEVFRPDPEIARAHWAAVESSGAAGQRICRGFDVTAGAGDDVLEVVDLRSRRELCLRGLAEGTWTGALRDLDRFTRPEPV